MTPLDPHTRSFYFLELKHIFADRKAGAFQEFFARVMNLRYPDDFVPVATWGSAGDLKCDGFLKSERRVFAVYAPNEFIFSVASKKIRGDFVGALAKWKGLYDEWTLVHNSRPGLPAPYLKLLLSLEKTHKKKTGQWGFQKIEALVFDLPLHLLVELFGHAAPSVHDYVNVSFEEIRDVVGVIAAAEPALAETIRPVPAAKVKKVGLSDEAQLYLQNGMRRADRVQAYFNTHLDPLKGDRIASAFREKYQDNVAAGFDPDENLMSLRDFASGIGRRSSLHEAATWAVMAYLFERCEIFTIDEEEAAS